MTENGFIGLGKIYETTTKNQAPRGDRGEKSGFISHRE
jgi:hypothetical protein